MRQLCFSGVDSSWNIWTSGYYDETTDQFFWATDGGDVLINPDDWSSSNLAKQPGQDCVLLKNDRSIDEHACSDPDSYICEKQESTE